MVNKQGWKQGTMAFAAIFGLAALAGAHPRQKDDAGADRYDSANADRFDSASADRFDSSSADRFDFASADRFDSSSADRYDSSSADPVSGLPRIDQIGGYAVGTIDMPTIGQPGVLVAVGKSKQGPVYMLDAELSTYIPGLFDRHNRVAFGGVHGQLREAPSAGSDKPFQGHVEGYWRMDKNLMGRYEALVFALIPGSGLEIVGRIQGAFRITDDGSVLASPSHEPVASAGADLAASAGADLATKSASSGAVVESSHQAYELPFVPALSGVTRLHFMLLD